MGLNRLVDTSGKVIKIKLDDEALPLFTFSDPTPRFAHDNCEDVYLYDVCGIRLRTLNGLKASPHFLAHRFNGGQSGDFVAIELRKAKIMTFISEPHEIVAALRELGY